VLDPYESRGTLLVMAGTRVGCGSVRSEGVPDPDRAATGRAAWVTASGNFRARGAGMRTLAQMGAQNALLASLGCVSSTSHQRTALPTVLRMPRLPDGVSAMLNQQIMVQDRAVEAALHGDRTAGLQALLLDSFSVCDADEERAAAQQPGRLASSVPPLPPDSPDATPFGSATSQAALKARVERRQPCEPSGAGVGTGRSGDPFP
jgi:hypothetical protein